MNREKKARGVARSTVTRTINEIKTELAKDAPNQEILELKLQKLREADEELQHLDQQFMNAMLDGDATEEQCIAENIQSEEYRDRVKKYRMKINKLLPRPPLIIPEVPVPSEKSSIHQDENRRRYRLPKIEIRKFNGDVKNWLSFWSQFQKIHEDEELHESDKFQYLIQSMEVGSRAKKLVESYPQSGENYIKVVEALQDRFGDKVLLAEVYVRELLKFVNTNLTRGSSLSSMHDELESHLRSLETLGVTAAQSAIFLYPMVESSLPMDVLKAWQRSPISGYGEEEEINATERLKKLMKFIRQEVKGEERLSYVSEGVADKRSKKLQTKEQMEKSDFSTVSGLFVAEKRTCIFCEKPHNTQDCWQASTMSLEEKNLAVKNRKCCFICLRPGHASNVCRANLKCAVCDKKHFVVMCPDLPHHKSSSRGIECSEESETGTTHLMSNLVCSSETVLKTMMVTLEGSRGRKLVRALLDDGSQRSYVAEEVAEEVGFPIIGQERIQHTLFGGVQTSVQDFNKSKLTLMSSRGGRKYEIEALEKKDICGEIARVPKGSWMKRLKDLKVIISDVGEGLPKIDLLLGAKDLAHLLTGKVRFVSDKLVAIETKIGWTLMGESPTEIHSFPSTSIASNCISMHITCIQLAVSRTEESIGVEDPVEVKSEDLMMNVESKSQDVFEEISMKRCKEDIDHVPKAVFTTKIKLWECNSGEESRIGSLSSSDCGLETGRSNTDPSWIHRKMKIRRFVGNRVCYNSSLTQFEDCERVPVQIVQEFYSRGCKDSELFRSRWWEDPQGFRFPRHHLSFKIPGVPEKEAVKQRRKISKTFKKLLELLWRYRKKLWFQLVHRGKAIKVQLHVGDIVQIEADNKKRWEWPMELIEGKVGQNRVAKVKTQMEVFDEPSSTPLPHGSLLRH